MDAQESLRQVVELKPTPSTHHCDFSGSSTASMVNAMHCYAKSSTTLDNLTSTVKQCIGAMKLIYQMEGELVEKDIISDSRPDGSALIEMECKLLDLAVTTDLCSEVFYTFVYCSRDGKCCARYLEAGALDGFFLSRGQLMLKEALKLEILPYRVYSKDDVELRKRYFETRYKRIQRRDRPQITETYKRMAKAAKSSISKHFETFQNFLINADEDVKSSIKAMVIYIYMNSSRSNKDDSLFYHWGLNASIEDVGQTIINYSEGERLNVIKSINLRSLAGPLEVKNEEQQMLVLSALSNAFWKCHSQAIEGSTYMQRISWKQEKSKYNPSSIRNRIIYSYMHNGAQLFKKPLYTICKQFLLFTDQTDASASSDIEDGDCYDES